VIAVGSTKPGPLPFGVELHLAEFTDLVATAIANAESRAELAASRARIVAASDDARRRIERDLHDGAQQRLVSLGLELRAAEQRAPAEIEELKGGLHRAATEIDRLLEDLREISRGIHPAILSEAGLGPALKTLARRASIPVEVDVRAATRLPDPLEAAVYYVASEALTNAAKHAQAALVRVVLEERGGALRLSVRDDGIGGADPGKGSGLIGLYDRVEALGGSIELQSPAGRGTLIVVQFPLAGGPAVSFRDTSRA
jgi:signal transduction histidine kinase